MDPLPELLKPENKMYCDETISSLRKYIKRVMTKEKWDRDEEATETQPSLGRDQLIWLLEKLFGKVMN